MGVVLIVHVKSLLYCTIVHCKLMALTLLSYSFSLPLQTERVAFRVLCLPANRQNGLKMGASGRTGSRNAGQCPLPGETFCRGHCRLKSHRKFAFG